MAPGRLLSNCATAAFTRCLRQGRSASAITPSSGRHGTMGHRRRDRTHLWITSAASTMIQKEDVITGEPDNNVTDNIYSKIGVNLHLQQNHPLCILKNAIYDYFKSPNFARFRMFEDFLPIVSTKANFDELLIPEDHVSRSPNDTYYINNETVLRCHTSAHQGECLRMNESAFLVTGDVYRRDAIDATHYPVFHQTEGVRVFSESEWKASEMDPLKFIEQDLKQTIEGLAKHLFGDVECRWLEDYFPFTEPSYELEILFNDEWLEVAGCGIMRQEILDANYGPGYKAWAFGLGLERLAMILFDIPDIRLFWSTDPRFQKQFKEGDMRTKFKFFSKYPPVYRDIAFWLSPQFSENNFFEIIRGLAGDLCEEVKLVDHFTHPKTERTSHCYRITYRSNERSLVDDEVNDIQTRVRDRIAGDLKVELR